MVHDATLPQASETFRSLPDAISGPSKVSESISKHSPPVFPEHAQADTEFQVHPLVSGAEPDNLASLQVHLHHNALLPMLYHTFTSGMEHDRLDVMVDSFLFTQVGTGPYFENILALSE